MDLETITDILDVGYSGNRKPKKDAVFNAIMNSTKKYNESVIGEPSSRLAGALVDLGRYDGSTAIRTADGMPIGPDNVIYGELDTSNIYKNIPKQTRKEVIDKKNLYDEIVVPDVPEKYRAEMYKAKGKIIGRKMIIGRGKNADTLGYVDDNNTMSINLDQNAPVIGNTFAHEGTHVNTDVDSTDRDKTKYGDRDYELVAQLGGNRHMYDKELIKKVHPFIDYSDGKFTMKATDEMIRRMKASGKKVDMKRLAKYRSLIQKEVDRLNMEVDDTPRLQDKLGAARWDDGDSYSWRD